MFRLIVNPNTTATPGRGGTALPWNKAVNLAEIGWHMAGHE